MIARSLAKVLENREMNVTGNTWTFLSIMKLETKKVRQSSFYKLEKKPPVQKDLWILAEEAKDRAKEEDFGTQIQINTF